MLEWRKWEDTNDLYCSSIIYVKRNSLCLSMSSAFLANAANAWKEYTCSRSKGSTSGKPSSVGFGDWFGDFYAEWSLWLWASKHLRTPAFFLHAFSFEGNFCLEDRPNYLHFADEALHCITLHFLGGESLLHCLQWCFHYHVRLFTPWRHQTTRRLRKLAVRNGQNKSTVRRCPSEKREQKRETSPKNPQKQKNDGKKNGVKSHTLAAKRAENEEQNAEPRQKGRTKKQKTTTR